MLQLDQYFLGIVSKLKDSRMFQEIPNLRIFKDLFYLKFSIQVYMKIEGFCYEPEIRYKIKISKRKLTGKFFIDSLKVNSMKGYI